MSVPASIIASPGSYKNPSLIAVPDVDIDKSGKFKYILVKVRDPTQSQSREFKHIVRGYNRSSYHNGIGRKRKTCEMEHTGTQKSAHFDIYEEITPAIEDKGLDCECVGGGRIHRDASKKLIEIYGYSQQFGRADHAITQAILDRKFKEYDVKWSNAGY